MLLHTEAFEHRCLFTQKHLPRYALTNTRVYTQKLLDTGCFSENRRSFDTEKPLHRESFTHRSFCTHKLFHRSFYTEKLLRTGAFTHRRLYTQKLVHTELLRTEAFTQRSLYAQTLSHRKTDSTEQLLHALKSHNFTWVFDVRQSYRAKGLHPALEKQNFLTLGNHFAWKGCAWPCKIAILYNFYFARNGCAWRFKIGKVAILHQFLNVCIWH